MNASKAFGLVIGLILLALVEGILDAFLSAFKLEAVLAFQTGIAGYLLSTKLINDVKEMRYSNGVKKP